MSEIYSRSIQEMKKTILITGCSSGIGLCVAKALKARDYRVFATARRHDSVSMLLNEGLESFRLDLMDSNSIHFAFEEVMRRTGGELYALFNNGAYGLPGAIEDLSRDALRDQFETNVLGVFKLTKAAVPLLQERKPGRMVMISSVSGLLVTPFVGAYAGSKFALEAFTDAYRNELGMLGIRVIGIQPGPVATPIWAKARAISDKYLHTPYSDILARQEEFIQQAESRALPVDRVVRTVVQAATADQPRSRYLLVTNPWLVRIAKLLPDRMKDKMIMARLGQAKKW